MSTAGHPVPIENDFATLTSSSALATEAPHRALLIEKDVPALGGGPVAAARPARPRRRQRPGHFPLDQGGVGARGDRRGGDAAILTVARADSRAHGRRRHDVVHRAALSGNTASSNPARTAVAEPSTAPMRPQRTLRDPVPGQPDVVHEALVHELHVPGAGVGLLDEPGQRARPDRVNSTCPRARTEARRAVGIEPPRSRSGIRAASWPKEQPSRHRSVTPLSGVSMQVLVAGVILSVTREVK